MKKRLLLISILFIGILSLSTLEVKAFVTACDQGFYEPLELNKGRGASNDTAYISRLRANEQGGYIEQKYKDSTAAFFNATLENSDRTVSQYQLTGEVKRNEPVYFFISYNASYLNPVVNETIVKCGNVIESGADPLVSTIEIVDSWIVSPTFMQSTGTVHLVVKITPKWTTKEMLDANYGNFWFRVNFYDEGKSTPWHFVVIGLHNVVETNKEKREKAELAAEEKKNKQVNAWWSNINNARIYGLYHSSLTHLDDKERRILKVLVGVETDNLTWLYDVSDEEFQQYVTDISTCTNSGDYGLIKITQSTKVLDALRAISTYRERQ